jgi:serine/threonine-protein kinase
MVVSPALSLGPGDQFAPYEYVQPIGSRPNPLYVVRYAAPHEKPKLVVAERFIGVAGASVGPAAAFVAEARRISTLASPNVGRVRELAVRGEDLLVFWDFIEGDKLADLWLTGAISLELALRLILDVLSGAGAIQALRDAKQQPMNLAHGELSTASVVIGIDGIGRILHAIARRFPDAQAEEASLGYLAPEVHSGAVYDARADVFSAGVLLWEALSGRRLFTETDPAAILARIRSGGIGAAEVPPKAPWAQGLVAVAAKALAPSPEGRWPSPGAMAAEIRKLAGLRLAPASAASSFAQTAMGARVKARRDRLESSSSAKPRAAFVGNSPEAVRWSAPAAAGSGVRRWSDAESSSAGAPVTARAPEPAEPPTTPRGETALESLPPTELNSVIPESADAAPEAQVPPPPPLPARALQPATLGASKDEASSGSDLAASIDVPFSLPPPSSSTEPMPAFEQPEPLSLPPRVNRRRTVAVLSGVSALGMIVFALAGWRVAHRASASPSIGAYANATPTATSEDTPIPRAAQPSQAASTASSAPTPPATTVPTAPVTAAHALHSTMPVHATPPPRPAPATHAPRKLSAPSAPTHAKSTTNARFDPNSL